MLSFLLHNFDGDGRVQLLRRAVAALDPGGRIGVLEWALPSGRNDHPDQATKILVFTVTAADQPVAVPETEVDV